ncbi:hypothetical protein IKD67_02155 [Candidatus Saccharibacteria bacterium]|nr:hypothetical protein [Candidatus Saccharibacteria bacterium]
MSNIIIPGEHGIGSQGFVPTSEGYGNAADALVRMHNEGRHVNTSDHEIHRVMSYFGASSMEELKIKRRGW